MITISTRRLTAIVLAFTLSLTSTAITQAESSSNKEFSTTQLHDSEEQAIIEGFERLQSMTVGMPVRLQNKPMNSPEVREWLRQQGHYPIPVPYFNALACGIQVTTFLVETGFPAAKMRKIIDSYGGTRSFAKILRDFIQNKTLPTDATAEATELFKSLTGIGDVIATCS